jgi:ribonuclease P protein subunit RPR2
LSGMPAAANAVKRGGRRGRRTSGMVRIARERIGALFALAEREAGAGHRDLADRYVALARRIGTRYNIRLVPEYRELYCRGCSTYWVEGLTVRTRLRSGRRSRTCLRCGRVRRTPTREVLRIRSAPDESPARAIPRDDVVLAEGPGDEEPGEPDDESEES